MIFLHNFKRLIKTSSVLTVLAHTLIEKFHFLYSEKEYCIVNYIKKPIIIDVGAHNGESIYNFLKQNQLSKIISIEPNRKNYEIIKSRYKLDKRIRILNYLIANKKKSFIFTPILLNKELSQMSSTSLGLLKQRIKFFFNIKLSKFSFRKTIVKTIKIDQLKLNPNIIKIDTEGSELEVLKSAKKTIKIYKPIIIVEYNHNNFIKIDKLMKNFDYNSYQYSKNKLEVLNLKKKLLLKKQKNAENIVYLSNNKNNKQLKKIQKLISK